MMYSRGRRPALAALCLIFAFSESILGQTPAAGDVPTARAHKVTQAPSLDGRVADDPAWAGVQPLTDFWQTAPDAGQPASERTEVRIAYTEEALYFGVTLFDQSAGGLTVSDSRRDSPLDDVDSFRILLDTYKDRQNGFVFATNPAALEYDGQVIGEGGMNLGGGVGGGGRQQGGSGGGFNLNWDGAWRVRTAMTDNGWSAEFEIPFRTLRYEPGSAREWGLNFQRTIRRRKESAYWSPLPFQFDLLKVSQAGTLAGLDLPAQRNLKLIPYALGEIRERGAAASRTTALGDVGLDAKYGLTPSLTLDATVNTDFAQVEVDEQQVNLDRFNLFFPEKRPFFLENAGLFAVGASGEAEVFFSRRIGIADNGEAIPIIAGGRLSGKAGPVNVGLLNMQTDDTGDSPMNNFTVARVRRDFANRSNLGAIFVGRYANGDKASSNDHNASFAVDGRWGIGRTGLISGFAARSATPGLSGDQHAYQIGARNETQPLTLNVALTETGRNFNPEVGFLSRRGGFRKFEALAFSRLRPKSLSKFQEIRPHAIYRGYWNPSGFLETGFLHTDAHWELKNAWEFHTGVNVTREGVVTPFDIVPGITVPAGEYEHAETQLVLQSNQGAPVYGRMQVTKGGFFNGNRIAYNPQLRVRVGETLNVEMSLERNDIELATGSFITNLARMRASYSFSPRVFVQSLIQYNDRADVWTSNFRFGWLQQANTGVFLVYTDSHDLDERAFVPPTGTNRSLILKISRMFDAID
jgi:hypothetical protein